MHFCKYTFFSQKIVSFIVGGILGIGLLFSPTMYLGAETRVIRLTDNLYPDVYPQMHGGFLTWQAFIDQNPLDRIDGDWEIFLCRLSTRQIERITDNAGDDTAPQTNGRYIVWQGEGENSSEIFLYDDTSKIIRQITNDRNEDFLPQIWEDWVVWASQPQIEGVLQPGEIFLYQISTQEVIFLSASKDPGNILDDMSPYIGYVPADNSFNNNFPAGKMVLWSQSDGENSVSFLYNLETGFTESVPEEFIWPENRQRNKELQVVSRSLRDTYGQDREIFIYQTTTKQYQQITNNTYPDRYPCLLDRNIAWMAGEGDEGEIFLALYDPNACLDSAIDLNALVTAGALPDPVIPPFIKPDLDYTPPGSSPGGSSALPIEPGTRCFISSCWDEGNKSEKK